MRKYTLCLILILLQLCLFGQTPPARDSLIKVNESDSLLLDVKDISLEENWSDEYLDTVKLDYNSKLNNYSMIGFNYGLTLPGMSFSPSHSQSRDILAGHYSLTFTKYEKMFNYLPYFGWTIGIEYGWEGYHFKTNKETGETYEYYKEKCQSLRMRVIEVPFMLQVHSDGLYSKIYAGVGIYGGYRLGVERFGPNVEEAYRKDWYDTDIRWDYGFQGGLGFAIILDPVEIHIDGQLRYGLSSIFTPNSLFPEGSGYEDQNRVYYRYAYPLDFIVSVGVHLHLEKRFGTTKSDLKKQAREIVYGTNR